MFLFKKILGSLALPLPFCLLVMCVGWVLLWRGKKPIFGKMMSLIGLVALILFSLTPVAERIEAPLKYRFSAYGMGAKAPGRSPVKQVDYVVVLAGGHNSSPQIPITGRLYGEALFRMMEGLRIFRQTPGAKLVLSGHGAADPVPEAMVMADFARYMGVSNDDIILETGSYDTEDQARLVKAIVGDRPFVLVTSALHLPRAMALFNKQGMHPIPAPAGKTARGKPLLTPGFFFPNVDALRTSTQAIHEYLGLIWAKWMGQA